MPDKPPSRVLPLELSVVNDPAAAVVPPIAGGLDKSSVPPSVKLPDDVTVPVKVKPLTVPVPATEVTVPEPLLLNVVQSAALNTPRLIAEAVGTFKVMTGVDVLLATVDDKSVPVVPRVSAATDVTVPVPAMFCQVGADAPLDVNT